jgi:hypothetical protein
MSTNIPLSEASCMVKFKVKDHEYALSSVEVTENLQSIEHGEEYFFTAN